LPYGIPGPSRTSGSQEQPIIISDEEIKVKTEKGIIEESTEEVTEKGKKTVSKSFFCFFYFAFHKFF
jgi:hypothetical protein